MDNKDISDSDRDSGGKRIELSVPQVAGSAAAAVTGAVLASGLSVYGTIIGAGVVSVVATTGGALYQHLFKRTSEQIREVAKPLPRLAQRRAAGAGGDDGPAGPGAPAVRDAPAGPAVPPALRGESHPDVVPGTPRRPATGPSRYAMPGDGLPVDAEFSRAIPAVGPPPGPAEPAEPVGPTAEGTRPTRVLGRYGSPAAPSPPARAARPARSDERPDGFGAPTEHGRTRRTLRARLAVSAGVFALAMGAITGLELATDSSLFGWWHGDDKGGTTIGRALSGDGQGTSDQRPDDRDNGPDRPGASPSGSPDGSDRTPDPDSSRDADQQQREPSEGASGGSGRDGSDRPDDGQDGSGGPAGGDNGGPGGSGSGGATDGQQRPTRPGPSGTDAPPGTGADGSGGSGPTPTPSGADGGAR